MTWVCCKSGVGNAVDAVLEKEESWSGEVLP